MMPPDRCGSKQSNFEADHIEALEQRIKELEERLHWKEISHMQADERIKELEALLNKCDEAITAELSKEPMPFIVWQCQQEIKQMLNKPEKG